MSALPLTPPTHIMRVDGWACEQAARLLMEFAHEQQEPCCLTGHVLVTFLHQHKNVAVFIAIHDKEYAGVLCVQKMADVLTAATFLKVEALYVVPPFRTKGVGRALLKKLDDYAVQIGAKELEWEAWERDRNLLALYDKTATRITGAVVFRETIRAV